MQAAAQVGLVEIEAFGDTRQIPDRIDRRLHHTHAAVPGDDIAVGANAARCDRGADFRHVDMGAGDRNRRPHVVAAREMLAEDVADQMPPGVKRYDFLGIAPLRVRADALDRRGIGEVGDMIVGERSRGDRERAVNRVAAGMAADRIAMRRVAQGRDHRSAFGGAGRAPNELRRLNRGLHR